MKKRIIKQGIIKQGIIIIFVSCLQGENAVYQHFADKELLNALEKEQQKVAFLTEKITLLEHRIEDLTIITNMLKNKIV